MVEVEARRKEPPMEGVRAVKRVMMSPRSVCRGFKGVLVVEEDPIGD